jgi:CHAD domain-containing protein
MTPGLAGFVASGDDAPAWAEVIAGVVTALEHGFAVVPERGAVPGGAQRRTWFDTFDWRLYRAGLVLEYVAARRGGELHLTSANPANAVNGATRGQAGADAAQDAEPTQPVTGWQASRPHMPDLHDGPVTARVASLVWPRALLPAVTVSSTATMSKLLNEDGKTVARLLVEHPCLASGEHAELPPRLTITEVRGYPGQARRAARIVALTAGVLPATETVFADALRAIGRRPGDYSNKVDAPITGTMPAAQAAAIILLRLLDTIEANVAGVLRDTDTEFLHDLRVAVRRTRSALKLFGDALTACDNSKIDNSKKGRGQTQSRSQSRSQGLTEDDVSRFAAEFKWVGDLTTPTRDLDVHLLGFDEMAHSLAAAKPDDLEPFRGYLEQRRVKEFRALVRGLRSPRFTQLLIDWRAALTKAGGGKRSGKAGATPRSGQPVRRAGDTASTLAADRTRRAFTKVAKRGAAITPASPHESLHDLRKRCKELRYALEFFAPLHDPAEYGKVVGDLKRLQDCLGEFQDNEVQIDEIRALAAAMLAAAEAPAVTLLAMGEVTAGLAARQALARTDFERRFAAFGGTDGQRRMAVLLRGGAG